MWTGIYKKGMLKGMPKSKLADSISAIEKFPPIDWVSALMLERMKTLGFNYKTLADAAHIGYESMRKMNLTPIYLWRPEAREAVCKCLGLDMAVITGGNKVNKVMIRPLGSDYWFEVFV